MSCYNDFRHRAHSHRISTNQLQVAVLGLGNNNPLAAEESYQAQFARLRINAMKKVALGIFSGIRYELDHYSELIPQAGGSLETSAPPGIEGGLLSGLGLSFTHDSRDNQFYPRLGSFVEASFDIFLPALGSTFNYQVLTTNSRCYLSLLPRTIMALNLHSRHVFGIAPFYELSFLGGSRQLRGLFEGQQRDKHAVQSQVELRQELFESWGFCLFGGLGLVSQ